MAEGTDFSNFDPDLRREILRIYTYISLRSTKKVGGFFSCITRLVQKILAKNAKKHKKIKIGISPVSRGRIRKIPTPFKRAC